MSSELKIGTLHVVWMCYQSAVHLLLFWEGKIYIYGIPHYTVLYIYSQHLSHRRMMLLEHFYSVYKQFYRLVILESSMLPGKKRIFISQHLIHHLYHGHHCRQIFLFIICALRIDFCPISAPNCIPCTQCQRSSAWIKQITIVNIVNIGISSAWSLHGMHSGLLHLTSKPPGDEL